jgi:hypothetical protein
MLHQSSVTQSSHAGTARIALTTTVDAATIFATTESRRKRANHCDS